MCVVQALYILKWNVTLVKPKRKNECNVTLNKINESLVIGKGREFFKRNKKGHLGTKKEQKGTKRNILGNAWKYIVAISTIGISKGF